MSWRPRRSLTFRTIWLLVGFVWMGTTHSPSAAIAAKGDDDEYATESVVLLHGLARSSSNMLILEWRLEALDYRVCNLDYDTRVDSIERAAEEVFESFENSDCARSGNPTHFVTHSLGGLVLRSMLDRYELPSVSRAVMLAPPNHGSEIADWFRGWSFAAGWMGGLMSQLGTGEQDLPNRLSIPRISFGVIAGDRWINPVGPWLLPAPHDGTVSVASTRLAGMADHLVVPHTHTFIMNSAEVAGQIHAFLSTGRFRQPD